MKKSIFQNVQLIAVTALFLSACVQEDQVTQEELNSTSVIDYASSTVVEGTEGETAEVETTLAGSVGDGPIIHSTITIFSSSGITLQQAGGDAFANYRLNVKAGMPSFPLQVQSVGGVDLVTNARPTFTLVSTASAPSIKTVNINPHSTLIVHTARALGQLTPENIDKANALVTEIFNFGLDQAMIADPINTEITEGNVAVMVKASEALAEMIRRTRLELTAIGISITEDEVIKRLAADIVDGVLDGAGASGSDFRTSVIARLVTGAVMLENISNRLKVNGVDAVEAMDQAMATILPNLSPPASTKSVGVTDVAITHVKNGVGIAQQLAPSMAVTDLSNALVAVAPDSSAQEVSATLASADTMVFSDSLSMARSLSEEDLALALDSGGGDTNNPPVISGSPVTTVAEGVSYSFIPGASDPDNDAISFTIANKPVWAAFNNSTGALTGTPDYDDSGSYTNIIIGVSDGVVSTYLPAFTLNVTNTNRAPAISGSPATTVAEGSNYRFVPIASDPDADSLLFSISNKPAWASFNVQTGELTGTPGYSDSGTYSNITIRVSDAQLTASLASFSIIVSNSNRAPTAGAMTLTLTEDSVANTYLSGADPDGDALVYSIVSGPLNGTVNLLNAATGQLSYVPNRNFYGSDSFSYRVRDVYGSLATANVSVSVQSVDDVPVTVADNSVVVSGDSVVIDVLANDNGLGDGSLVLSVSHAPSLGTATVNGGKILYTATSSSGGTDSFEYMVVDGDGDTAIGIVTVQVEAAVPTVNSITLNWSAPVEREDGTPIGIGEISGYRIYFGTSSEDLSVLVNITDNSVEEYVIDSLSSGTYYFSVTAYDVNGTESGITDIGSMTIL